MGMLCGWPSPPQNCNRMAPGLKLLPGGVVVLDNFLDDSELDLLRGIVTKGVVLQHEAYGKQETGRLSTTFSQIIHVPDAEENSVLALLQRIQGNAVRTIESQSAFKEGPWAFQGAFYPDYWSVRRYHNQGKPGVRKMDVHTDTGSFGRCLSAVLFFGEEPVMGGAFRTHRCKRGSCLAYGWQHDKALPPIPESHLHETNLETLEEVPYKAGRLVFFLSETLHDVTEAHSGSRDVLFMWFGCTPSLLNSIADNGHMSLVEFLVENNADVTKVNPSTGEGPIHHAVGVGHVALTEYLLARDPDAWRRRQGERQDTPLHAAAALGHKQVVTSLAKHGADVLVQDAEGQTPENYAMKFAPEGVDREIVGILKKFAPRSEL